MSEKFTTEESEHYGRAYMDESRAHISSAETTITSQGYEDETTRAAVATAQAQMAQAAATQALVHTNQLLLDEVRQLTRYAKTISEPAADLTSPHH